MKKQEHLALNSTNRYSPGYCGWHVSEQHKFFAFLPQNYCGIELSDSALMKPVKSVSAIIGIGKDCSKRKTTIVLCVPWKIVIKETDKKYNN